MTYISYHTFLNFAIVFLKKIMYFLKKIRSGNTAGTGAIVLLAAMNVFGSVEEAERILSAGDYGKIGDNTFFYTF